jgi:DNA-binding transcriptional LysR family regulator
MNLNQLKIFYLAAKYKNLTKAAKDLNITQPAVTKGIQRLQEHYEVMFVNRFGQKLALTDAGKVLYGIAEKIFEMERYAEDSIREFQKHKKGHIRIHSSESFGAYYLPSIMTPFCKKNPFVKISIDILPTEQVVGNIIELKNDVGFISYPIEDKKIILNEILKDHLVLIVSPANPLAQKQPIDPHDLEKQPMIVYENGSALRTAIDKFIVNNKISVNIPLELSSNQAIKKAVEDGLGVALISRQVADEEIQAGRLVAIPLSGRSINRKFYMVYHRDKYISEILKGFIDTVKNWATNYMKAMP